MISSLWAQGETNRLGQGNDGNRSTPIHRIGLFDESGKQITEKDPKPFSTKQTCGQCHDYEKIATGWHFNGHDFRPHVAGYIYAGTIRDLALGIRQTELQSFSRWQLWPDGSRRTG